jgi:uncharacterized SAM-binding protein YcdF (DUF218 family)
LNDEWKSKSTCIACSPYPIQNPKFKIHNSNPSMIPKRRFLLVFLCVSFVFVASLASWIQWSDWPDPDPMPVFANADAMVILGGGDFNRWQHGLDLARSAPDLPLIVTGDDNHIVEYLAGNGIPLGRIQHEERATSTVENAKFTAALLDRLKAKRVILVTNWFHAPRALAIFRKYQAGREFTVSFSPKPEPLTRWDQDTQRRERMAVIHNLLVRGVGCF